MDLNIIKTMHDLFQKNGHKIRAVGGCVRDDVLGIPAYDIDFATTATPDQMIAMGGRDGWTVLPTGIDHGTVTFMSPRGSFEVTTLRRDVETDGRHAKVEFTDNWKADAARRDFTFNAMYYDYEDGLIDFFGGYDDIHNGVVRFVGLPEDRIQEDYLRMVRWCRFQARFGGYGKFADKINRLGTIEVIKQHSAGLDMISVERIWSEFKKAHSAGVFQHFMDLMIKCKLFNTQMFDVDLSRMPEFPEEHSLAVIMGAILQSPAVLFAEHFKLSRIETVDAIKTQKLFKDHLHMHDVNFRKLMHMEGVSAEQAKCLAAVKLAHGWGFVKDEIYATINAPMEVMPVNGDDMINLGMKGQSIGEALFLLKTMWVNADCTMSRDQLLKWAEKMSV